MTTRTILSASTIDGDRVRNAQGEDLGHVKDIMIDMSSGKVAYYVLSFGGFLEMGDKLFAIPPEAMRVDHKHQCLTLDVSKDQLETAPGFDKDNWPDMADPQFRDRVYGHYGFEYPTAYSANNATLPPN